MLRSQLTVWSQRVLIISHSVIKCTLIWLRDMAVAIHLQKRCSLLGTVGLQKMPPCFNIHCYKGPDSVLVCVCVFWYECKEVAPKHSPPYSWIIWSVLSPLKIELDCYEGLKCLSLLHPYSPSLAFSLYRDFLPRGSGIVTRRPLILQLVNNKAGECVDEHSTTEQSLLGYF